MYAKYKIISKDIYERVYYGTLTKKNKFEKYANDNEIKQFSYDDAMMWLLRHNPPTGEVYRMKGIGDPL